MRATPVQSQSKFYVNTPSKSARGFVYNSQLNLWQLLQSTTNRIGFLDFSGYPSGPENPINCPDTYLTLTGVATAASGTISDGSGNTFQLIGGTATTTVVVDQTTGAYTKTQTGLNGIVVTNGIIGLTVPWIGSPFLMDLTQPGATYQASGPGIIGSPIQNQLSIQAVCGTTSSIGSAALSLTGNYNLRTGYPPPNSGPGPGINVACSCDWSLGGMTKWADWVGIADGAIPAGTFTRPPATAIIDPHTGLPTCPPWQFASPIHFGAQHITVASHGIGSVGGAYPPVGNPPSGTVSSLSSLLALISTNPIRSYNLFTYDENLGVFTQATPPGGLPLTDGLIVFDALGTMNVPVGWVHASLVNLGGSAPYWILYANF